MVQIACLATTAYLLACTDDRRPGTALADEPADGGEVACEDVTVYRDEDGDGFGVTTDNKNVCLAPTETEPDYARAAGDCKDEDPWANEQAAEICDDSVDDDCDGEDRPCPTTMESALDEPDWDCSGTPPDNVIAWALFADNNDYFESGTCFIFYEGLKGEFYVKQPRLEPKPERFASGTCDMVEGCICPSLDRAPSEDRRLYALSVMDAPSDCPDIAIQAGEGAHQPVSNHCRKYLLQLHFYPIGRSYVGDMETLHRRLDLFPRVEIACLAALPDQNLPFASLAIAQIVRNAGFRQR